MKQTRQHSLLKWGFVLTVLLIASALIVRTQSVTVAQEATETTGASAADIVAAANAFIDSLDDTQRAAVLFDYSDDTQRNNWSNLPAPLYNRSGITYGSMTETQREAVMTLLQAALSDEGYQKVINIMTGDELLRQTGTGIGGSSLIFGFGEYYVSILGTPSETDPWMLQWGGHHLALNITFSGADEVLTPSHTACQPCVYTLNDQPVYVLGDEYSKALALVNALDADQQAQAILDYSVTDLVLGPGEEERVLEPEGLPGSAMTAEQQTMMLDVIGEWVNIANESAAATRMAELQTNINDTYFAWSGDISENSTSYFRITGPTLLIEFAPQGGNGGGGQAGGSPPGGQNPAGGNDQASSQTTNPTAGTDFELDLGTFEIVEETGTLYHVHTIYRDPTNPYGSATVGA